MCRFLIVLATLAVCSAPTWADSSGIPPITGQEFSVNAWAVITAPSTCPTCVERIHESFLFQNSSSPNYAGEVIPGSLSVQSTGFLGTFSSFSQNCDAGCGNAFYLGTWNTFVAGQPVYGDEIDLYYNDTGSSPNVMVAGRNNMSFDFWACETAACSSAYQTNWVGGVTGDVGLKEGSTIRPVHVPAGDSFLPLSLSAFGAFTLAWRWRRRPEPILAR
jgi:hypothetical protein